MSSASGKQFSLPQRILMVVVPFLAAALLRLLDATLRYQAICAPGGYMYAPQERGIGCFWHRCLLCAACYFRGRPRTTLLISRSFDGELIARTIERLGFLTVRGSSSRGGVSGLRALAQAVQAGASAVFPADGPRGPRFQLKPGAIKLGQLTGLQVGCFYLLPARAWQLRSWDAFLIPKPFSRVLVVWGKAVEIPRFLDEAGFEAKRAELETAMEDLRRYAEEHVATRSRRPPPRYGRIE